MQYDVDYFIRKFEAIPEEKWCTDILEDGDSFCAMGYCGVRPMDMRHTKEAKALIELFATHLRHLDSEWTVREHPIVLVTSTNDGKYQDYYKQSTPKQRILAALHDIKKLNSEPLVKECDATKLKKVVEAGSIKTVIKYVSVPETISESLPETILS